MSVEIATLISEMCYNPDTDAPFTVGMIQRAMKDSHITVKMNQSPKKQALSIIQVLKKKMRIERNQMKIQLAFPEHRTSSPRVTSSDSDGDDVLREAGHLGAGGGEKVGQRDVPIHHRPLRVQDGGLLLPDHAHHVRYPRKTGHPERRACFGDRRGACERRTCRAGSGCK